MNFKSLLFCLSIVLFTSCGSDDNSGTPAVQEVTATVSFSVTTDVVGKPANITYTDAGSSEATINNRTLPWNLSYTGNFNPGETIVLKAVSIVPGEMTASISINGEVVATGTDISDINLSAVVN